MLRGKNNKLCSNEALTDEFSRTWLLSCNSPVHESIIASLKRKLWIDTYHLYDV